MIDYKKNYLIILYACLFVIMIGYGLILPVLPFYIERMALAGGASLFGATTHTGILTGIFALMQFFFAPLWGKWSDRIGRRPLFLLGLGGYAVSMIFFGLGTNLEVLYVTRTIGGMFSAAIFPVATAYVTDLTSIKDRGRSMAWLGSSVSSGIVVGPALGAFLSRINSDPVFHFLSFSLDGFSIPFFVTALLSFVTLGAALRWLPESLKTISADLPASGNQPEVIPRQLAFRQFVSGGLYPFLILAFISQFALATFEGTFALHARELLNYGPAEMGLIFVVCGLAMALAQGIVVSRLMNRVDEKKLLPAGFVLMTLGLILLMTSESLVLLLLYVAVFALGVAFITPALTALVSKHSLTQPGRALGFLNSSNSLGQSVGPALGGFLLARQVHSPYIFVVILLGASAVYLTGKSINKSQSPPVSRFD